MKGQNRPQTAFYWENPYYINPAFINLDYFSFVTVSAKKQWMDYQGSPSTFFATGTMFWEEAKSQAGVKILQDQIGYMKTLDFSLSYSHSVQITWNSFLNLGVAGVYLSQSVDRKKVTMDDINDPILNSERMRGLQSWDANLGAEWVYDKKLRIGISGQNILSFFKKEPYIFESTNYLYARLRTRTFAQRYNSRMYGTGSFNTSLDVEYGLCMKMYRDELQLDGMVSLYFNRSNQPEKYQLSLIGRSTSELGFMFGVKLIHDLKVLCSYDYNFKAVKDKAYGTFEVIVSIPLRPNDICRSEWDLFN
jgi:type IX secretion system PorP/SprF family membrane protein